MQKFAIGGCGYSHEALGCGFRRSDCKFGLALGLCHVAPAHNERILFAMKIDIKELRPNLFRHLERYPIDRAKVDALKRSIKDTTFWDNLLVRKSPNGAGGYE